MIISEHANRILTANWDKETTDPYLVITSISPSMDLDKIKMKTVRISLDDSFILCDFVRDTSPDILLGLEKKKTEAKIKLGLD